MESLKTQYPPNIAEPRAFEVQSAKEDKRRRSVSTPVPPRQNRPNSTGKMLELTPLWDQLQRYNRLPQNVEAVKVFSELALRLEDPEWEVRLHALRVLVDLLPAVAGANSDDIDALMIPVVLTAVINNLGHTSPSVRKGTLEVLGIYIKHSADSEYVLRCIVSQGLESPAASGNLTMSVINGLPHLLQQTIRKDKTSNRQSISHQSLVHLVTALSKKLLQSNCQKQAVNSLMAIKELVGENRFYHLLESYYPQVKRDLEVLCKVYEIRATNSNINDSGIDLQGSVENSPASIQKDKDTIEEDDWSETMTMSPVDSGMSPKTRLELNHTPILDDVSVDTMRYNATPRSQEETPRYNETPRSMDTSQYLDTPRSQDTITTHETQTPRCSQEVSRTQENKDAVVERRDQYGQLAVKVTEDEDEEEEEVDDEEEEEEEEEEDYEEDVKSELNFNEQEHDDDNDVAVKKTSSSGSQNKQSDIERYFGECTGSFDAAGKVVMETEIKFDEDTAITMTILEEKEIERRKRIAEENSGSSGVGKEKGGKEEGGVTSKDSDRFINDFVMKVLEDEEAELEGKKVQRRVRFGGEVIKLRTPDSDITIEVAQSDSSGDQGGGSKNKDGRILESTDESTGGDSSPKQPPKSEQQDCGGGQERRPRSSHIPLPIVPATHRPQDPRRKRRQRSKSPADPFDFSIPNCDGGESLTSSSEGEQQCRLAESRIPRDEWHRLGFIDGSVMDNILNKDDWRGRVRSLDRLALALRQAEFSRYLATVGQRGGLALLSFLLRSLHDDRSQRLVSSSLRAARSLVQVLPVGSVHSTLACLVPVLCRHIGGGGGGSVMVKLEAVAALKTLMRVVRPQPIVDILFADKCFGSRSSKQRESSLLCLMYSLMTFPSTEFSCGRLANWIVRAASREPKRRVRQSILETLAVLAQFVPRSQLKVDIGEYPPSERDEAALFGDALHARLSRKLLPTVSPEGLILYAIQLPPTLTGADIEWIMRGSGSVSAGSAKNRTQLDNAQRAFNSPPQTETPSSSGSWRSQDMMAVGVAMNGVGRHLNNSMLVYPSSLDDQKSSLDVGWGDSRHATSVNYGVVRPMYLRFQQDSNHSNTLTPDGFSHIAPSYLQSPAYASRKLLATSAPDLMNQTWPPPQQQRAENSPVRMRKAETALDGGGYYVTASPPYRVTASPPHVSINPNSLPPLVAASQDWPPPRSTAPGGYHWSLSSSSDNQQMIHHHAHHHHNHHQMNDGAQRIAYEDQRQNRWSRTPSEPDVYLKKQMGSSGIGGEELTQKPVLARHYGSPQTNGHQIPGHPTHAGHTTHTGHTTHAGHPTHAGYESSYQTKTGPGSASANNRLHLTDNHHRTERQLQGRTSHQQHFDNQTSLKRIEFSADSDDLEKTPRLRQPLRSDKENVNHDAVDELYGEQIFESGSDATAERERERETQEKDRERHRETQGSERERHRETQGSDRDGNEDSGGGLESDSPPTPPPPPSPTPQLLPPHLHEIHPSRQTPMPLDIENYLQLGAKEIAEKTSEKTDVQTICCDGDKITAKQKITRPKIKPTLMQKGAAIKGNGKLEMTTSPSLYPESLPAFDHPKEGLNKCLSHIENNDWEMTIQGMQSMIRLARHHPHLLLAHTHTLAGALSRHIRSLRSQVARASCQATALLFAILGKPLENELEDLAGSLFNRTADTNKFLRGDCTHALDCMVEHINPNKSIPAIISKGAKHQNAVVRTVASRLLAGLCAKLGAERVLSLPKQIRDSILNTGAKLLTEGSLETRKHAKELFSILSADARLPQIMADVVPNNLMRNISKTLNKLHCNNS